MAMALNPMEQFEVKPLIERADPAHRRSSDIFFTNQALLMLIVTVAASLFLTLAMSRRTALVPGRAPSRWPRCPTNSSPTC